MGFFGACCKKIAFLSLGSGGMNYVLRTFSAEHLGCPKASCARPRQISSFHVGRSLLEGRTKTG